MSQQTPSRKPILILDANAFISCTRLIQFGKNYRLITTSSVIDELKDQKTKQYISLLPYQIQQKYHDDKLLNFVKQFAKKTGDIGSLSDVDMELIALVCTIYKEEGFGNKLRKQPVPIKQKVVEEETIDEDQQDEDEEDDEQEQEQTKQQQKNNQVNKQKNNQVNNQNKQKNNKQDQQGWITVPNTKKKQQQQDDSDMSDEQGWITPVNYHKKMAQINTAYLQKKQQPKKQQSSQKPQRPQEKQQQQQTQPSQLQPQFQICLISADFAIQNVATQMGIKLLSLDGRVISSIRRFIWQCYLCWKQHKVAQNKVKLCTGCGYNSLSKIAYSLDMNGNAILHRKKGWKPNTTIQEWKEKSMRNSRRGRNISIKEGPKVILFLYYFRMLHF